MAFTWGKIFMSYKEGIKNGYISKRRSLNNKKKKPKVEYSKKELRYFEQKMILDGAIGNISKIVDINKYRLSVSWIKENLCELYWFQYIEEAMITIELIKNGMCNFEKMGLLKPGIRFMLPDDKIIIDLIVSDSNSNEDCNNIICSEWAIIKVSTKSINKDVRRLTDEIVSVKLDIIRDKLKKEKLFSIP